MVQRLRPKKVLGVPEGTPSVGSVKLSHTPKKNFAEPLFIFYFPHKFV
jgi:hypothetical protein